MPQISVIVPVYGVQNYIEKCIQSILSQTLRDIEVILINDGSPDQSGMICEAYSQKDARIKYFSTPNHGVGSARNLGMKNAVGEWLCFVDGDDYLPADALENLLRSSQGADIVIGDYFMDRDGRIIPRKPGRRGKAAEKSQRYRFIGYTLGCRNCWGTKDIYNLVTPWGKLYQRSFCEKNNLMFPEIIRSEDVIFNLNAYQRTDRIIFTECRVYFYRLHDASVGHRYVPDFEKSVKHFLLYLREALCVEECSEFFEFYVYKKQRFLIDGIRRTYAHPSCPMSRPKKIQGIKRFCEDFNIKTEFSALNRDFMYFTQYVLLWLLSKEHYSIALYLFDIQRILLGRFRS